MKVVVLVVRQKMPGWVVVGLTTCASGTGLADDGMRWQLHLVPGAEWRHGHGSVSPVVAGHAHAAGSQGRWFWLLRMGVASPRLENDGVIELPPDSVDLLQVRRYAIGWRASRRLSVAVGQVPDNVPFAPTEWPFVGLLAAGELPGGAFSWRMGAQRYGTYVPQLHRPEAATIGRVFGQVFGEIPLGTAGSVRGGLAAEGYSDPNRLLAALYLGHRTPLATPAPTAFDQRYRPVTFWIGARFGNSPLQASLDARTVKNLTASGKDGRGLEWLAALEADAFGVVAAVSHRVTRIGAAALPAVAVAAPGFPGRGAQMTRVTVRRGLFPGVMVHAGWERNAHGDREGVWSRVFAGLDVQGGTGKDSP